MEDEVGGGLWREERHSAESTSSRRSGWSRSAAWHWPRGPRTWTFTRTCCANGFVSCETSLSRRSLGLAHRQEGVSNARASPFGRVRLHRVLPQPNALAFDARLSDPSTVRTSSTSLGRCQPYRHQPSGHHRYLPINGGALVLLFRPMTQQLRRQGFSNLAA